MIRTEGFVDLRVSPSGQIGTDEDSVWPSFTDIMMVVVMIFLMALVVILIRNVDLVRQLRATLDYGEQAATERTALALRAASLGDELAALQLKLGATSARRQQQISQLLGDVAALEQVRDDLVGERDKLTTQRDNLEGDLLSLEQKHLSLEALRLELENEVVALSGDRTALQDEKTDLISRNTGLAAEREQLLVDKAALLDVERTLEARVAGLTDEISTLHDRLFQIGTDRNQVRKVAAERKSRIEALSRDIASLEQIRDDLEGDKRKLTTLGDDLTGKLQSLDDKHNALIALHLDLENQLDGLLGDRKQLALDKAQLLQTKAALETKITTLDDQLAELTSDKSALQQEKQSLQSVSLTLQYFIMKFFSIWIC